ncbi:N-acetylglucosaminyl-phosphatidylinositol de-N-acetylase [Trapelia coarctata]|nr:N-acetylglucosaminyl-phosphatidylinositol de-N-acetylase [Trapelia coarctata]
MQLYLAVTVPVLLLTLWLYTAHISRFQFPRLVSKRICLLIAHPDDEAMFFAPTILVLTNPELGNHVKILCLSSGNADGLGETRKQELIASALLLGLRSPADVFMIDDAAFPDSMTTTWSAAGISSVLSSAFIPSRQTSKPLPPIPSKSTRKLTRSSTSSSSRNTPSSATSSSDVKISSMGKGGNETPTSTIDILITFDRYGISRHPNHISLNHGALHWLKSMMKGKEGWECPVTLYTLTSTNILRKYISVLDAPFTMLTCVLASMRGAGGRDKGAGKEMPRRLMYLSDVAGYRTAQKAMTAAHKSQMRWFRWGWIGVGRYMVVNDLRREKV